MDWQTISQANARGGLVRVLFVGCVIFVLLAAVGRLRNAPYMQHGLWEIFLVSLAISVLIVALYEMVYSAFRW
jgi:hypothetical protein